MPVIRPGRGRNGHFDLACGGRRTPRISSIMTGQIPDWPVIVLAGVAGLLIGSFLNVVIHRGPGMWKLIDADPRGDLLTPRSYCPSCRRPIPASGLVPILSYLRQGGKCLHCGSAISPRYPIVEALGGLTGVAAFAVFGPTAQALGAAIFGWALIALAVIDLETGYLPDAINYPLIAAGLAANATGLFASLVEALAGAAAGYVLFWAMAKAFERLRGKEGLGLGDAKLLAAIGAWGGWIILPAVVFAAAASTLVVLVLARSRGGASALDQPAPFGPGLCAAGFICLLLAPWPLSVP